ncbi:YncE family protein [Vibrio jasicida]|uniref:YncE family protein n=1 Tax=Vibrio jasicida TaxID=766224 RepID=UPI004068DA79
MNKTTAWSLMLLASVTVIGCSNDDKHQTKYTTVSNSNGNVFEIPIETVFENLSTPESVTIHNNDIYVSNIGGNPSESPNLGFLTKNGKRVLTNLDDPKGMAIIANGKFAVLSDHPNIKLIDLELMSVVQTLPVDSAGFLNDAVSLSENTALISDTGTGDVYKVVFSGQSISYSTFITSDQLNGNGVNGLAFNKSDRTLYLITSSFGGDPLQGHIYQANLDFDLNLVNHVHQLIPSILGNGNLDGIAIE